jgi:hypothetical protein
MAWTYDTLSQAIRDYVQVQDEPTFDTNLPIIVKQAEDRILKDVQLPDFRKNVTGTMTSGDQYLCYPTDMLSPYSLSIDNSGAEYLLFKLVGFIREAYPIVATTGVPKHYAIFDTDNFIVGPTPNSSYTIELHYFYRPTSIVTASTTWLGTNAEATLLYGCLVEAYTFLKGSEDLMVLYDKRYKESLQSLKVLGEGRLKTDEYRSGI